MIGLSPLSSGHPPGFQPRWVRPSTGSYPRFSLPMDSSPGFASTACDSTPGWDSLSLRLASRLTSPQTVTRWLILQKARRHSRGGCSDCSGARGFRCCFTPLSGCFSPFPHGTGPLSVTGEYLGLEGGPPCFPPGFTCPAVLGYRYGSPRGFAYGALTLFRRPSQAVRLRTGFVTAPRVWSPGPPPPATPRSQRLQAVTDNVVWSSRGKKSSRQRNRLGRRATQG